MPNKSGGSRAIFFTDKELLRLLILINDTWNRGLVAEVTALCDSSAMIHWQYRKREAKAIAAKYRLIDEARGA